MTDSLIHPTAVVHKGAVLGQGVRVGPWSIIGPKVTIGDDTWIDSHVVIEGRTTIGRANKIWRFSSIGTSPQDLKFRGEDAALIIGDSNQIREYVNISIGTEGGGMLTKIGSHSLFMVNVHVGHDCIIGDHCVFANGVSLAGHVEIGNQTVVGGHVAIHQFCKIGSYSMTAGGSIIVQDVTPFILVQGNHAKPHGLNLTGLRRQGFDAKRLADIKEMYRWVYRSNLPLEQAVAQIKETIKESPDRALWLSAVERSKRGLAR